MHLQYRFKQNQLNSPQTGFCLWGLEPQRDKNGVSRLHDRAVSELGGAAPGQGRGPSKTENVSTD
jgi:hypothetical protein